jgi:hypothetical protein
MCIGVLSKCMLCMHLATMSHVHEATVSQWSRVVPTALSGVLVSASPRSATRPRLRTRRQWDGQEPSRVMRLRTATPDINRHTDTRLGLELSCGARPRSRDRMEIRHFDLVLCS